MSNQSLAETLGFRVPPAFLKFVGTHADTLLAVRCSGITGAGICLCEEDVCDIHESAVESSLCIDDKPPAWFKKFVAIGADGGGGYYFIKRSGSLRIWMMDSDWYAPPKLVARSITRFAEQLRNGEFPDRNLQWWKFWVE